MERLRRLKRQILYFVAYFFPKLLVEMRFERSFGRKINWNIPKDLNEKTQWLQFYSDTSRWSDLADKYKVREYVKSCGCEEMLNELYGKWDCAENLDFDLLPDSFVLKSNNGCATVLIVEDKKKLDYVATRKLLQTWLHMKFGVLSVEPHYLAIQPCIIAEKFLKQQDGFSSSLIDYKFFCINGEPCSCLVCYDRIDGHAQLSLYSIDEWKKINHNMPEGRYGDKDVPRPRSLESMVDAAKKLSEEFPSVRVDFYEIGGKPVFGELTFTSCAGLMDYFTPKYLRELGDRLILPLPVRKKKIWKKL